MERREDVDDVPQGQDEGFIWVGTTNFGVMSRRGASPLLLGLGKGREAPGYTTSGGGVGGVVLDSVRVGVEYRRNSKGRLLRGL